MQPLLNVLPFIQIEFYSSAMEYQSILLLTGKLMWSPPRATISAWSTFNSQQLYLCQESKVSCKQKEAPIHFTKDVRNPHFHFCEIYITICWIRTFLEGYLGSKRHLWHWKRARLPRACLKPGKSNRNILNHALLWSHTDTPEYTSHHSQTLQLCPSLVVKYKYRKKILYLMWKIDHVTNTLKK